MALQSTVEVEQQEIWSSVMHADAISILNPTTRNGPEPETETQALAATVWCRSCNVAHRASELPVESVHRSAEGLVSYVRCPSGRVLIYPLAEAYPKPKPPAAVLALRARLAAEADPDRDPTNSAVA